MAGLWVGSAHKQGVPLVTTNRSSGNLEARSAVSRVIGESAPSPSLDRAMATPDLASATSPTSLTNALAPEGPTTHPAASAPPTPSPSSAPLRALPHTESASAGLRGAAIAQSAIQADPAFAGAWIDGADTLHLSTAGSPDSLLAIAERSPVRAVVEIFPSTRARLLEVRNDIASRAYPLAGEGISLVAIGLIERSNAVRVTASVSDWSAVERLRASYPDVKIEVLELLDGSTASRGTPRDNAAMGYHGGAIITPVHRPGYRCVVGVGVRTNRGPAVLTAGHCGAVGEGFELGHGTTAPLGVLERKVADGANGVRWPDLNVQSVDAALITAANEIGTMMFDDRVMSVSGHQADALAGQLVYASLGRSGVSAPGRITETHVIVIGTADGFMPTTVANFGISHCVNPGDSGSPVGIPDGVSSVLVAGIMVAVPDAQCSGDALSPEHPSEAYVASIEPALRSLEATLITG